RTRSQSTMLDASNAMSMIVSPHESVPPATPDRAASVPATPGGVKAEAYFPEMSPLRPGTTFRPPARRPDAGAMPGRRGRRLAATAPRPLRPLPGQRRSEKPALRGGRPVGSPPVLARRRLLAGGRQPPQPHAPVGAAGHGVEAVRGDG